jgi:hypothetical protein
MLGNLLHRLEAAGAPLRWVKGRAREGDRPHMPPNLYMAYEAVAISTISVP